MREWPGQREGVWRLHLLHLLHAAAAWPGAARPCPRGARVPPQAALIVVLPLTRRPPARSGVNVRTRKRNIVVPSDPGSFADAIVQIFQDAAEEGAPLDKNLEAGCKVLDSADLDFSRYADTLFEVLFAGGRLATGGNLADDAKEKLATNVRSGGGAARGQRGAVAGAASVRSPVGAA